MKKQNLIVLACLILQTSCASSPPSDVTDVCSIFEDRRSWYKAARNAEQRWGVPIAINMAFIYQESAFEARAKPARSRILWIFPGPRASSAYGYAQALDTTWAEYMAKAGNRGASRANFADAVDFVAWYNANSSRISRIDRDDARDLYYAYHEGNGGYQRGSYRSKQWLVDAAARVQSNSSRFATQLEGCRRELDKNWFQRLIS
ncbi:MAG TPA: hypothetical protein EYN04_11070 [Porticoccaceae bacterium]|nr:hypothetical protein [Porticoccaceae bacterium]